MDLEPVSLSSQQLVLSIFENSPTYFMRVEGCMPTLATVEESIVGTPTKIPPDYRKEFLVIRRDGDPIGTVEIHVNYPESSIAYIGLLLIRENLHGQGLGRQCYFAVEKYLCDTYSCKKIRLGVSDENDVSGFWSKLGFRANGHNYSWEGECKASNVVEYEKPLMS